MHKIILIFFLLIFKSGIGLAQIPVSQEPRHHMVLSNTHLRLLDVHIPPADTSQFHIHATPSVFILLNSAKSGSEVIIEEDRTKYPVYHYGNIYFEGFYSQSRIHRVWNSDSSEFHVMDVELPNRNLIEIDSPIVHPSFIYLFDEKPVRAYRVVLKNETGILIPERKADILVVCLSDSTSGIVVNKRRVNKKGNFLYVPAGTFIEIKKDYGQDAELAFFELK